MTSAPVYLRYVGETEPLVVDWSDLLAGDTIAEQSPPSVTFELPEESPPPLEADDVLADDSTSTLLLQCNAAGDYEAVAQVVTTGGQTLRRTLRVHVRTR